MLEVVDGVSGYGRAGGGGGVGNGRASVGGGWVMA